MNHLLWANSNLSVIRELEKGYTQLGRVATLLYSLGRVPAGLEIWLGRFAPAVLSDPNDRRRLYRPLRRTWVSGQIAAMDNFGRTDEFGITNGSHVHAVDASAERSFFLIVRSVQPAKPVDGTSIGFVQRASVRESATRCGLFIGKA